MSHNARQTGPALEAMYRFTLWLIPTLEKFPRSQRFLLGERIETAALDVLDLLIQATYTRERVPLLRHASLRHPDPVTKNQQDTNAGEILS